MTEQYIRNNISAISSSSYSSLLATLSVLRESCEDWVNDDATSQKHCHHNDCLNAA